MAGEDLLGTSGGLTRHDGAPTWVIASLQQWAGTQLPQPYLDLLSKTNGAEGFISETNYLVLWPADQVAELNEAYSVGEFAPGLLLIGSDGSDTGFALDTRHQPMTVQAVPFVGMSLDEAKTVGSDFEDFLRRLEGRSS